MKFYYITPILVSNYRQSAIDLAIERVYLIGSLQNGGCNLSDISCNGLIVILSVHIFVNHRIEFNEKTEHELSSLLLVKNIVLAALKPKLVKIVLVNILAMVIQCLISRV